MSDTCTRRALLVAVATLVAALPVGLAQGEADGPSPADGLAIRAEPPVDRSSAAFRVENVGPDRVQGVLRLALAPADQPTKEVARVDHVLDLGAGNGTIVRLSPTSSPYGPHIMTVTWNGTDVRTQPVHAGVLSGQLSLMRAAYLPPTAGPTAEGRAPKESDPNVPTLRDGAPAPDHAIVITASQLPPGLQATVNVTWVANDGFVLGREPVTNWTTQDGWNVPVPPALAPPGGTQRVLVELTFEGGAVMTADQEVPPYRDPFGPERTYSRGASAPLVGALILLGLFLGAGTAIWGARRGP